MIIPCPLPCPLPSPPPAWFPALFGSYVFQDPDAAAYVAAVESALSSSISATQKNAIDDFIKTGKQQGWYSSIKRLYLPIWADASANAIDLVTRGSGTFVGVVTHGAGFVQGNGSTGYFDMGVTPASLGLTLASSTIFALGVQAASGTGPAGVVSSIDGLNLARVLYLDHRSASTMRFGAHNNTVGEGTIETTLTRVDQTGILVASREGGERRFHRRSSSSFSTLTNVSGGDFGSVPTATSLAAMRSQFGSGTAYSDGRYGAFGASLGLSVSVSEDFSLALKNLWETCTGLTLP